MMSPNDKESVAMLHVLKYNGTLQASVLATGYRHDLVMTRKVIVPDVFRAHSIDRVVRHVLDQCFPGYLGSYCWQFPENFVCSYYQSLLDHFGSTEMEDFSVSYVIRKWGDMFVRLTSILPRYRHNAPVPKLKQEKCPEETPLIDLNDVRTLQVYVLNYNGIVRPSVNMRIKDETPLASVGVLMPKDCPTPRDLPNRIRQAVRNAFPGLTSGLSVVVPAEDVLSKFQNLLDKEPITTTVKATNRKFSAAMFFPLYPTGDCNDVYVRLMAPLSRAKTNAIETKNLQYVTGSCALVCTESSALKRTLREADNRHQRQLKFIHTINC